MPLKSCNAHTHKNKSYIFHCSFLVSFDSVLALSLLNAHCAQRFLGMKEHSQQKHKLYVFFSGNGKWINQLAFCVHIQLCLMCGAIDLSTSMIVFFYSFILLLPPYCCFCCNATFDVFLWVSVWYFCLVFLDLVLLSKSTKNHSNMPNDRHKFWSSWYTTTLLYLVIRNLTRFFAIHFANKRCPMARQAHSLIFTVSVCLFVCNDDKNISKLWYWTA